MRERLIKRFFLLTVSLASLTQNFLFAQPSIAFTNKDPYWIMVGVSWNTVNDNEEHLPNLLDVTGSWNSLFYPSRLSFDKHIKKGWSWEVMSSFNRYQPTKIVNDLTGRSGVFFAVDGHVKHSFARRFNSAILDPYVGAGIGVTYRSLVSPGITPTANLALGTNIWFDDNLGIQLQVIGKLALGADIYTGPNDYVQYTAGLVYRKDKGKKRSTFHKKRHKWASKRKKKKKRNNK